MSDDRYSSQIEAIRQTREKRMTASPVNWFTLAGLFPLREGGNRFGSDPVNDVSFELFPYDQCGSFFVNNDSILLLPSPGIPLQVNGKVPAGLPLRTDVDGQPDMIEVGRLSIRVIKRGGRLFLRVWDREAEIMKTFPGLRYYPVNPAFCLETIYVPYETPKIISITDAIGTIQESRFPGEAQFALNGVECRLMAQEDEDGLLFNFTDLTREDSTYPGGRYLETPVPVGQRLVLDFNLAVNWPCAYTSFATCPFPPPENRLPVRVEAGEKRFH